MKKPVIYDQELHRPIEAGETLDPSAIPISSEAGNIMTVGGDGLYVPSPNLDDLPEASVSEAGVILLASAAEAQELSNADKAVTPSTLGAAMNSHVLGMGQTWQNMISSRSANTVYTNTTGRAIAVSGHVIVVSGDFSGTLRVNTRVNGFFIFSSGVVKVSELRDAIFTPFTAIVPHGSTYRVDVRADGGVEGNWHLGAWRELR